MLALALGAAATSHLSVLLGAALFGLAFFFAVVATYRRDPVLTFIGLWIFSVFDAPLSAIVGYTSSTGEEIRQGDEVLVLLLVLLTARRALRTDLKVPPLRFILPGVGVALFGFLGAITHDVSPSTTLVGALLGLKLWIIVVVTMLIPWRPKDLSRVYKTLMTVGLFVAALGLLDYLTHGGVSRLLHTNNDVQQGSYRSEAVHSIFPTPGEYSLFMSLLFGISFSRFTNKYSKSDLLFALLFAGSVMLSLRLKGFLSIAAVVAIVGVIQGTTSSRRAIAALVLGSLLIAGAYTVERSVISKQISTYASSETSARSRLYKTSEQIAWDNFPLGVGFGRFASYPSRTSYSPVYYEYRLNGVYGLSPTYPDFIDDTSWPTVIGETGYGGLIIYVIGLIMVIAATMQRLRRAPSGMRWVPLAALCSIAVLLVDSSGDPSLFSWLATTTVAMILGPTLVALPEPRRRLSRARTLAPQPGPDSASPTPTPDFY